ncbi:MAG TPA: alpha/beta fold hydrolase [Thermoanaerobaculaceae bacterium]|nr:alpha/beta fold hydrolase [Thermoanaerobaculaceae bacterium]HRS16143.1 alpha/beta fold hydrolase [Thermoanaerobaculaceae bacterium]
MKIWVAIVLLAVAVVLVLGAWGAWWVWKRPLEVFAMMGRQALERAGMRRVEVKAPCGVQSAWVGGAGPALLLLHGAGDSAATWSQVAPGLVGQYRVVALDLAGHGKSEPSSGPIDVGVVLGGVEAALDQLVPGERATLVGNSLGAWVAMLVAHRQPERVAAVVCINGGALTGHNEGARVLPKNRDEARDAVEQTRDAASPPVPGFVLDAIVREAQHGALARFAASASTMHEWVLDDKLGEIRPPVHLVWGESDQVMPLDYARRMQAELPSATLVTLERCGHVPQVECPARLLVVLRGVLGGKQ